MRGQLADARARNAALHALAAEARAAEATARSPRGEVEVTAGADGTIRAVRFSDDVDDIDLSALGRLTTETIAAAQRAAAALVPPLPAAPLVE